MIDVHYTSLTSQGVQHRVFYRDGHPSRYQPCPTGLNFGEQTGTGVFPLVIAVPRQCSLLIHSVKLHLTSFNYNILHDLRTFRYCISVRTDTSEAHVSSESSITDKTKEKKTPLKIAAEKKKRVLGFAMQ